MGVAQASPVRRDVCSRTLAPVSTRGLSSSTRNMCCMPPPISLKSYLNHFLVSATRLFSFVLFSAHLHRFGCFQARQFVANYKKRLDALSNETDGVVPSSPSDLSMSVSGVFGGAATSSAGGADGSASPRARPVLPTREESRRFATSLRSLRDLPATGSKLHVLCLSAMLHPSFKRKEKQAL
jgi:hypothetical protein